ncbi:hypothetical protein Acsp02_27630 [Actinoplanes sp. NBRC 103695]|nr:hypothetical protein Acsp02_27630 [Actinoplanes sp. NBRC 103695]
MLVYCRHVDPCETELVGDRDEAVGLRGGDVTVKKRLVEQFQVGICPRFVQSGKPVDQLAQEVWPTVPRSCTLHRNG